MLHYSYTVMVESADEKLYTVVMLPKRKGTFPIILQRTPYVDETENMSDEEVIELYFNANHTFVEAGYAVIVQQCRGTGKSTGEFIPFIYERQDGIALQEWVRQQSFYQEEIYLLGVSYTAAVHLVTAPYGRDIKGMIVKAMTQERYDICYRNGVLRCGLYGEWYTGMYKKRNRLKKNFDSDSFRMLPMSEYSKTVFGEVDEAFDEIMRHPDREDSFWDTSWGGADSRKAVNHAKIPILMAVGAFDPFYQGMLQMWRNMDDETRSISALVVSPYDHADGAAQPIEFEKGKVEEQFPDIMCKWFENIRGNSDCPVEKGKVTYYNIFENRWRCDDYASGEKIFEMVLGKEDVCYVYNPYDPTHYVGGLTQGFGGTAFQLSVGSHYGMQSFYSEIFEEEQYLKGEMRAELTVKSDCKDTCFYMRISLVKEEGDYGLRDDIHNLAEIAPDYVPGTELTIGFNFDYLTLKIQKGERLRIDVSSSAYPYFVPHTNRRGLFSEQTEGVTAHNTIICGKSCLMIPFAC